MMITLVETVSKYVLFVLQLFGLFKPMWWLSPQFECFQTYVDLIHRCGDCPWKYRYSLHKCNFCLFNCLDSLHKCNYWPHRCSHRLYIYRHELCEAYEVGWDFVIAPEQQQWQPHQNLAASHTGEGPSCLYIIYMMVWNQILKYLTI